jgi:hypothetical protein
MNFGKRQLLLTLSCGFVSVTAIAGTNISNWPAGNDPLSLKGSYKTQLSSLPTEGSVSNEHIPWSDSYWPKNRGGAAYRWKQFAKEDARQDLSPAEAQQIFMNYHLASEAELLNMTQDQLDELSPTEKFDIYHGKFNYPITKGYLKPGWFKKLFNKKMVNSKNDAYWEGYCNAWSAVSLHYPEPAPVSKTVMVRNHPITINFGSGDIKALMVASYAEQLGNNPQIGHFCQNTYSFPGTKMFKGKEVFTQYPDTDGLMMSDYASYVQKFQDDVRRLGYNPVAGINAADPNLAANLLNNFNKDLNCTDTDPGAFHVVMANQLGLMKEGFIIDKTTDKEIWNQPVFKFVSKVIGAVPLSPGQAATAASAVRVKTTIYYADDTDYGWTYWNPTLTNLFSPDQSFLDEFNRYQRMLIKQGDQDEILKYPNNVIGTAHYTYDLELDRSGSIVGGKWLTFDRPDIVWMPNHFNFVGKFSDLNSIYVPVKVSSDATPNFGDEE